MLIKRKISAIIALLFILMLIFPGQLFAEESWRDVADQTVASLKKASAAYENGNNKEALDLVNEAYFGPFESKGMEAAINLSISAKRVYEQESKFQDIRKAIKDKKPPAVVNRLVSEIEIMLIDDAAILDGAASSNYTSFFNSFIIIVREGIEAILIIGALIAYLIKLGYPEKVKSINMGAVIGLLASIVTALILGFVIKQSGAGQENLEGFTMLLAVAVLCLVSFWLLSKTQAQKWHDYIQGKVKASLTKRGVYTLVFAAFLAVYREGAETVLFYQALISSSPKSALTSIILGFVSGALILGFVYIIMRYASVKLPMKPFFTVTGILLFYLAFVFAGKGIRELQAGGLVSITPLSKIPVIGILGIYPTLETLLVQGLLLVTYIGAFAIQMWLDKKRQLKTT